MNLHLVEHSILANNASKVRVEAIYVYREWYKTTLDVQIYIENEWKKTEFDRKNFNYTKKNRRTEKL